MTDEKVLGILYRAQGAAQVVASTKQVQGALGGLTSNAGRFASTLKNSVGGALTTFGGRMKQFATAGLGILGVGGLFSIGGALTESIHKLEDFGASLEKVQTLTGETAVASGALIIQFQKFGLDAEAVTKVLGFTEKTLGKLASTGKLAALDKTYGLSLVNAKGQVADFSTVLEQVANYYDSNATASQKAYLASQVFGRGYTTMIPILNEGAAGLRAAAAEAKALGLGSTDTVGQLAKFHDQMHSLGEQVNLLQLSIGVALLPTLIDLSTAATKFVTDHKTDIVAFFKNVVAFGRHAAGVIGDFAGSVIGFWNSIPEGVRDLLIKGIVADRTMKFLFGISPIQVVAKLAESALGGVVTGLGNSLVKAGIGKAFVQPVFVTNMPPGGFGGGGGPAAPGGGPGLLPEAGFFGGVSLSSLAAGFATAFIPVLAAELVLATSTAAQRQVSSYASRQATAAARGINPANVPFGGQGGERSFPLAAFAAGGKLQVNSSGSPDERDQKNALELIRSNAEANRIALVAAQRTGTQEIVSAIRNIHLNAQFTLFSSAGRFSTTRVVSGSTLNRSSGKPVPVW